MNGPEPSVYVPDPPPPGSDVDLRVEDDGVVTVRFFSPPLPGWVRPVLATGAVLLVGSSVAAAYIVASPGPGGEQWLPPLFANILLGAGLLIAGAAKASLGPQPQRLTVRVDRDRLAVRERWRAGGVRGSWWKVDVQDVCPVPAAQVLAEAPQMELCVRVDNAPAVYVLAGRHPRELLWLAASLRQLLGLPDRRKHRRRWLRLHAPPVAPAGPARPVESGEAATVAPVPVLAYATPATRARAIDALTRYGEDWMTVTLWPASTRAPATVTLTPDELSVDDGAAVRRWRCDEVYAVLARFAAEGEPPELFVCWSARNAGGVDRVLGTVEEELLRQLADLLTEAMGLRVL